MKAIFEKFVGFLEKSPLTFKSWVITFFAMMGLTVFMQSFLYGFENVGVQVFVGQVIQPFYLLLYLAMAIFLWQLTKTDKQKVLLVVLWSLWLVVPRPVIDKIILGEKPYVSFYIFDGLQGLIQKYLTFFGPVEPVGILYGTRMVLIFILIFVFFYVYQKRKKISSALLGAWGVYTIFFLLCALPSVLVLITAPFKGLDIFSITGTDVAKVFIAPFNYFGVAEKGFHSALFYKITLIYNLLLVALLLIFQWKTNKEKVTRLFKNVRAPQVFFSWAVFLAGILIGLFYFPQNLSRDLFSWLVLLNLLLAVFFIWMFSVITNDIADLKIDRISNQERPLVKKIFNMEGYRSFGLAFFLLALLLSVAVSFKSFLIILLYGLIAWAYSNYPFRIKRIIFFSSLLSAFALFLLFLLGYTLVSDSQSLQLFPWKAILFLFFVSALVIPLKDIKDVRGDRADDVMTLPTLAGEKKTRMIIGTIVFVAYALSVFVFNLRGFFFISLIFGGLNYWIITNPKTRPQKLFSWILGLAFFYAILLLAVLF